MDVIVYVTGTDNLLYSPIPNDMLFSIAENPEIKVKVNNIYATCSGFDC